MGPSEPWKSSRMSISDSKLSEIRQDFNEGPFIVSQIGPRVEVFWHASQNHLSVDRAGPANYLASGHRHRLSLLRGVPKPGKTSCGVQSGAEAVAL